MRTQLFMWRDVARVRLAYLVRGPWDGYWVSLCIIGLSEWDTHELGVGES